MGGLSEQALFDAFKINTDATGGDAGADADAGTAETSEDAGAAGTPDTQVTGGISNPGADAQGAGVVGREAGDEDSADDGSDDDDYDDDDADTAGGDAGAGADAGTAETSKDAGKAETSKDGLTREQRRANAALRRKQEVKAAVDKAVADALEAERSKYQTELSEFFTGAQLRNTLTDEPIKSMDEFRAWKRDYDTAQMQRDLQAGKLTPESLERAIAESPAVKRAEEAARKAEEEQRLRDMEAFKLRADAEVAEIGKLDPSVKSIEDILALPTGQVFRELVQRGNSFIDAFRLANFERLTTAAAAAAKQAALTNARSKDHLTTKSPRGAGSVPVPKEEMALFKALMPNMTEAEIREYYNKHAPNSA